jgi:hypothetical protein
LGQAPCHQRPRSTEWAKRWSALEVWGRVRGIRWSRRRRRSTAQAEGAAAAQAVSRANRCQRCLRLPPLAARPEELDAVGAWETPTWLYPGLHPVIRELPLRIVALAFALPSTSFSSSYEVFLAEAELRGHRQQLIKLVYWFLPYQERLSDFKVEGSKMYKLRVTRDHACDESLAHMTVSSQGQVYPDPNSPLASLLASPGVRDLSLPCYRTTADDYRKAMSGKH